MDNDRYFLKTDVHPWLEVTFEQFLQAERNAGFRSHGGPGTLATGGFTGGGVSGRVISATATRDSYDWDEAFMNVAFPPP